MRALSTLSRFYCLIRLCAGNWDRTLHPKYSHKEIRHNPDPVVLSAQVRCIEVSPKCSLNTLWCCNFDERIFDQVKTLLSNPCHYSFLWFVFQELNETSKKLVQSETSLEMQIKVYSNWVSYFSLQTKTSWVMHWSTAGKMLGSITKKSGKSFLLRLFGLARKKEKFSLIVLMKFSRGHERHKPRENALSPFRLFWITATPPKL